MPAAAGPRRTEAEEDEGALQNRTAAQRKRWRLIFTTGRDGCSFTRFVALTAKRAPCLVVVRDAGGASFGGFAAAPLNVSSHFGGDYASFLFSQCFRTPPSLTAT